MSRKTCSYPKDPYFGCPPDRPNEFRVGTKYKKNCCRKSPNQDFLASITSGNNYASLLGNLKSNVGGTSSAANMDKKLIERAAWLRNKNQMLMQQEGSPYSRFANNGDGMEGRPNILIGAGSGMTGGSFASANKELRKQEMQAAREQKEILSLRAKRAKMIDKANKEIAKINDYIDEIRRVNALRNQELSRLL